MREFATWKPRLLVCAGALLAALSAASAQVPVFNSQTFSAPTPEQLNLVNKLTGIGSFHFGMEVEDLPKDDLLPPDRPPQNAPNMQYFVDTNVADVSWGGLHPDRIAFQFYYGKLVAIRLHFNEAFSDLLAVNWAVQQKYGNPGFDTYSNFADESGSHGGLWRTLPNVQIELRVDFPAQIPPGSDDQALAKKTEAQMELYDYGLCSKIAQDRHDALEQEVLKSHDLAKIKADL